MKAFFVSAFLLATCALPAQMVRLGTWSIDYYDWEDEPTMETREWITKEDEALVKSVRMIEYRYENQQIVVYNLTHNIIWVGSEKTIEAYNKLYIPILELDKREDDNTRIQARVLQPNGAIVELDEDDIQEGKTDEGNTYRYFALDGLKVGCIVEYLFLTRSYPSFYGSRTTLQHDAPIAELVYELVTPGNLKFKTKSYNVLQQAVYDTVLTEQNRYFIHQDSVPAFKKEPSAFEDANMGYIIYAIDQNYYNGMRDMSGFGGYTEKVSENVKVRLSKRTEKELLNILDESGMRDESDEADQIALIERYVKANFFVQSSLRGEDAADLDAIVKNKAMNEFGCLRLYKYLFELAEIDAELVFTSSRSDEPFDKDFENYMFLREDLMYFPASEIFIAPANQFSRMGCFSSSLHNTDALFLTEIDLGNSTEAIGEVRYIPPQNFDENRSELTVNWALEADGDIGEVKVERKTYGLQTQGKQPLVPFVPEEDMDEFEKEVINWMYPEVEFQDYEVLNLSPEFYPFEPLIARTHFTDEVYTEPGATSTIVKVGMIIGPQAEMYMVDSVRTLPVDHGFPRWYHREITITVPDGYTLKNTETLAMDVNDGQENPDLLFKSTYTYENNVLKIEIDEWYKNGSYPAEMFETYRAVINAAADFNKKYVVLEKL